MVTKIKALGAVGLVLALVSIGMCVYNYNGAMSEAYRGNTLMFGGILAVPLILGVISLICAVTSYVALKAYLAEKKKNEEDAIAEKKAMMK